MRFIHKVETRSTNIDAHDLARTGDLGPLWIRADVQSAGTGRRGREWVSKTGNLYASGLFPAASEVSKTAQLSFVAALAVFDTIKTYAPNANARLKWPNDVLVDDSKISGILLETGKVKAQPYVIVGIGINLTHHPELAAYSATHLLEHIDPQNLSSAKPIFTGTEAVLAILSASFEKWRLLHQAQGFDPIVKAWMQNAHGLGNKAYIDGVPAILRGLGENGELRVEYENGTIKDIVAADISFVSPK